jgi:HSP20 family protein
MARQQSEGRQESQSIEPRRRSQLQQPESWASLSPFGLMRRFADDMDRMFEDLVNPGMMGRSGSWVESGHYMPQMDLFERDGKFVVRADLPGMSKDDVHVDITENAIRIEGERKYEHESNEGGVYRSERSYGKFSRDIPLPEGVKTDKATATFKDGVLEVTLDASEMKKNRRRIQIQDESEAKPGRSAA